TFYFTFQSKAAQRSIALPSYLSVLKGAYLLLIDRNKTRCEQMKGELQRLDVSCVRVSSVAEATMFIRSAPALDGVVLDGAIADSFGSVSAAVETLRTAAENEHLPVIFLSLLNRNIQALPPEVTMLWKPIKQASFYQALRSMKPFTLATAPEVSPPLSETGSSSSPDSPDSPNSPNRCRALRILLAEDNRTNQTVALRLLELLGYKADLASSGSEVLAALSRQRYDVILMDMRMPHMDGVEATRQIRKLPMHANTWIIAMTANSMARDRKLCFSVGMNDYLRKPIKREALAQALRQVPITGLNQEDLEGPNQQLPG
ncbi:MAG: response regulator, partial [Phormidesmis sp.]